MGDARRPPRLAAGRARALGVATRGTTNPNRLRRVDRWLTETRAGVLRGAADPLIVDLGFGASPVTTVELYERVRAVRPDVRVMGLELADERVAAAADAARPPGLTFARGGFELAGTAPVVVRAMNVLRQYDEAAVEPAWNRMLAALDPGGLLIEGTCDEIGRRACWFAVPAPGARPPAPGHRGRLPGDRVSGARPGLTLTLSAHLASLVRPSELAERLPKTLIARNLAGEDVHALFTALDQAWASAAPLATFGPRQRWAATVEALRAAGWPVRDGPRRWRLGELTLAWPPDRAPDRQSAGHG
ncbi:MAG: class I SAM-dependent methyltransferase [Frankia sp.]